MITDRLRWYKNRLAAMSAAEILYRIHEAARRKIDRFNTAHFVATPRDYGALPEIPGRMVFVTGDEPAAIGINGTPAAV